MKARLLLVTLLSFFVCLISAQVPQGFNYQAIARDGSNKIIANQRLPIRITLQTSLTGGTVLWQETQTDTTNQFGLLGIVIGTGTRTGGTAALFSDIDWASQSVYLKTEMQYPSTTYVDLGTSQLWSVPYSILAKNLENPVRKLAVNGTTTNLEEALFEVKNNTGQTVFAVYNEGVRAYVEDGSKGTKGGFAIGGFGDAKAPSQEYLRVTRDSTRVYVNPLVKGTKGGFAIGGFTGKSTIENFVNLTDQNYFIGHNAGMKNTTGIQNSFLGYQSGMANTTGQHNSFMGYNSGFSNTTGNNNVFIGNMSGMSNIGGYSNVFIGDSVGFFNTGGDQNVFLGKGAGKKTTSGNDNVYIGVQAGYLSTSGSQNICIGNYSGYNNTTTQNLFIGEYAGQKNTSGTRNSFVGFYAGQLNQTGQLNSYFGQFAGADNLASYNTFIGYWAGGLNTTGEKNAFLGWRAGEGSTSGSNSVYLGYQAGEGNTGSNNVLIGYQAGMGSGAKSNVLYIDNSSTASPLIGGDFSAHRVGINRMPTTYTLEVGGTIWANGSAIVAGSTTWSDARYKKDVTEFTGALSDVLKMQGVRYNWRKSEFPDLNFPEGGQIGVIAQDLEKILPELVFTGPDGYKSVSYEKLTPVLIEAIKEQQKQIEAQNKRIQELEESVKRLMEK